MPAQDWKAGPQPGAMWPKVLLNKAIELADGMLDAGNCNDLAARCKNYAA